MNEKGKPTVGDDQWQAALKGHAARKAKMPRDIQAAHRFSSRDRGLVEQSHRCGCFYCLQVFPPSEIRGWVDPDGVTALCPKCGIDSVLPSAAGFPSSRAFLSNMNRHWF